jgi:hypothetical protein
MGSPSSGRTSAVQAAMLASAVRSDEAPSANAENPKIFFKAGSQVNRVNRVDRREPWALGAVQRGTATAIDVITPTRLSGQDFEHFTAIDSRISSEALPMSCRRRIREHPVTWRRLLCQMTDCVAMRVLEKKYVGGLRGEVLRAIQA